MNEQSKDIPKEFCCEGTKKKIEKPIIIKTGETYDLAAISQALERQNSSIDNVTYYENKALKTAMGNSHQKIQLAFFCQITGNPLIDPVVAPSGNTYERSQILCAIKEKNCDFINAIDKKDRQINEEELFPNKAIKSLMNNPVYQQEIQSEVEKGDVKRWAQGRAKDRAMNKKVSEFKQIDAGYTKVKGGLDSNKKFKFEFIFNDVKNREQFCGWLEKSGIAYENIDSDNLTEILINDEGQANIFLEKLKNYPAEKVAAEKTAIAEGIAAQQAAMAKASAERTSAQQNTSVQVDLKPALMPEVSEIQQQLIDFLGCSGDQVKVIKSRSSSDKYIINVESLSFCKDFNEKTNQNLEFTSNNSAYSSDSTYNIMVNNDQMRQILAHIANSKSNPGSDHVSDLHEQDLEKEEVTLSPLDVSSQIPEINPKIQLVEKLISETERLSDINYTIQFNQDGDMIIRFTTENKDQQKLIEDMANHIPGVGRSGMILLVSEKQIPLFENYLRMLKPAKNRGITSALACGIIAQLSDDKKEMPVIRITPKYKLLIMFTDVEKKNPSQRYTGHDAICGYFAKFGLDKDCVANFYKVNKLSIPESFGQSQQFFQAPPVVSVEQQFLIHFMAQELNAGNTVTQLLNALSNCQPIMAPLLKLKTIEKAFMYVNNGKYKDGVVFSDTKESYVNELKNEFGKILGEAVKNPISNQQDLHDFVNTSTLAAVGCMWGHKYENLLKNHPVNTQQTGFGKK